MSLTTNRKRHILLIFCILFFLLSAYTIFSTAARTMKGMSYAQSQDDEVDEGDDNGDDEDSGEAPADTPTDTGDQQPTDEE